MLSDVLKNNLIAMSIHVCICLLLILPAGFIWFFGVWRKNMTSKDFVFNWAIIGIYTSFIVLLYFFLGRQYLCNTQNILTNCLSVTLIPVVITMAILISLANLANRLYMLGLLGTPIYPISETISYFLRIKLKYAYALMSTLPSLLLCLGMATK